MKILLIISLISLSLCEEITLKAKDVAQTSGQTTKVDITLSIASDPSLSGNAPSGLIKLKSTTGTSISLAECAFGSFDDTNKVIIVTCAKGADGVYNLEATSVDSSGTTVKIDVSELTKAITFASTGTTATVIAANALTASKITKTDSGASITFQAAAALEEAHSVEGLFVVTKDTTKVSLTCSLASVAADTNSTATCTIPSNTAAGDYVLQVNSDGVVSGTHKFTVVLKSGITDADKTITISAAAGGAGGAGGTGGADGTDNKADFISFSKYLFTIFILFL